MRTNRRRYVRRMPKIYGNLQPKKQKWSPKGLWRLFRWALPIAIVGVTVYGAVVGPFFKVHNVEVRGASLIEPDSIKALVPLGGNIWSFPKQQVVHQIEQYPGVEDVRILRGLPDSILIEVVERKASALWVTGTKSSVLDDTGEVFLQYETEHLPTSETVVGETLANLPRIQDNSGLGAENGEQVASQLFLAFVNDAMKEVIQSVPGVRVDHFEVGATTYDVTMVLHGGLQVFFNSLGDAGVQSRNLARLARDGKLTNATRVDLRVDRWAYVR